MNTPEIWTGRRRKATPKRPEILDKVMPIYDRDISKHPDSIRVSFEDGSTAVYDIRMEQPHLIILENIEIIRKWNHGYLPEPEKRRRRTG